VSVARFIADQRTNHQVPHTLTCLLLGVSLAWFYKWLARATGPSAASGLHTKRDRRRDTLDRAVKVAFDKKRGLHGSPRLHADLVADGWTVTVKTVAESMQHVKALSHDESGGVEGSLGKTGRPRSSPIWCVGTSPLNSPTPRGWAI
jgi:hypothetical protein